MKPILFQPLPQLFTRSKVLTLDFAQISASTPDEANIEQYFKDAVKRSINPRLPENRQAFNNKLLETSGARYLIGRYGEDRIAMLSDTPAGKEGRTIHMAVDIFCKEQEPVRAPSDGEVVRSDYEAGFGEYGNYLIFKPEGEAFYIFFGHLANDRIATGHVTQGQLLAHLGDYPGNENGGWSRHLHVQILNELPPEGTTPDGYSTKENFEHNALLYPDPVGYFEGWEIEDV